MSGLIKGSIVTFRLSDDEKVLLEQMMSSTNSKNVSTFVRECIFKKSMDFNVDLLRQNISMLENEKKFLLDQIVQKDVMLSNMQLLLLQNQTLLMDKKKSVIGRFIDFINSKKVQSSD